MENIPQSGRHVSRVGIDTRTMALKLVACQLPTTIDLTDYSQTETVLPGITKTYH
jgi:hypothetical protein